MCSELMCSIATTHEGSDEAHALRRCRPQQSAALICFSIALLFLGLASPSFGNYELREDTPYDGSDIYEPVPIGIFYDSFGEEQTSFDVTQLDVTLIEADGTTQTFSPTTSGTNAMTHVADGEWKLELTATNTETAGPLRMVIKSNDDAFIPFHLTFDVLPSNIYDSKYGSDKLEVDVTQFGNEDGSFASGRPEVNTTHVRGSQIVAQAGLLNTNVSEVSGSATAASNLARYFDGGPYGSLLKATTIDTVANPTALELASGSPDDNAYVGAIAIIVDDDNQNRVAMSSISAYNGVFKDMTLATAPPFTLDQGDKVYIMAGQGFMQADRSQLAAVHAKLPSKPYLTGSDKPDGDVVPALLASSTIDDTTVAVTQTSFALTDGPPDDDALNGALVIITDATTSEQKAVGIVKDYDQLTKTVTLFADPGVFTFEDEDKVDVIASGAHLPLW